MVFVGMGNDNCIHTVQNFIHAHRQPDQRHFGLVIESAGKAVHGMLGGEKRAIKNVCPAYSTLAVALRICWYESSAQAEKAVAPKTVARIKFD